MADDYTTTTGELWLADRHEPLLMRKPNGDVITHAALFVELQALRAQRDEARRQLGLWRSAALDPTPVHERGPLHGISLSMSLDLEDADRRRREEHSDG